jgi:hypothetical protein
MPVSVYKQEYERIRRLSRRELRELAAMSTADSWEYRWATDELRRRETWWTDWRAWIAFVASLVALGMQLADWWAQKPDVLG